MAAAVIIEDIIARRTSLCSHLVAHLVHKIPLGENNNLLLCRYARRIGVSRLSFSAGDDLNEEERAECYRLT